MIPLARLATYEASDAEKVALSGGIVAGPSPRVLTRQVSDPSLLPAKHREALAAIERARELRARHGGPLLPLLALASVRLDVLLGDPIDPSCGFSEDWLLYQDVAEFLADWLPWYEAGWSIVWDANQLNGGRGRTIDDRWYLATAQRHQKFPRVYWQIDTAKKALTPRAVLADIRHPDYQHWIVRRALEVRRAYRMDGIVTGIKTGFLAQPQCLRVAPDGVWRQLAPDREWERTSTDPGAIGPITIGGAPYTAEEFRDAYVAMLGALADESLVVVSEGPPAYWRQAPWLSEGPLSGRLFGESRRVAAEEIA